MGMIACYTEANKELIEQLKAKSGNDLFEALESLEERETLETCSLDKLWDGLHFLLTGIPGTTPIENNFLSAAIVGSSFSENEESDFISYIYPQDVCKIRSALDQFDINSALASFSPTNFANSGIYPTIWLESDKDSLREELSETFQCLVEFFHTMDDKQKGVIVSIC